MGTVSASKLHSLRPLARPAIAASFQHRAAWATANLVRRIGPHHPHESLPHSRLVSRQSYLPVPRGLPGRWQGH